MKKRLIHTTFIITIITLTILISLSISKRTIVDPPNESLVNFSETRFSVTHYSGTKSTIFTGGLLILVTTTYLITIQKNKF